MYAEYKPMCSRCSVQCGMMPQVRQRLLRPQSLIPVLMTVDVACVGANSFNGFDKSRSGQV